METKHSAGPWSIDPEGLVAVSIEGADGSVVCDVHGSSNDPRTTANAHLIAAAPELFAELKTAARRLQALGMDTGRLERVIAKAKGAA